MGMLGVSVGPPDDEMWLASLCLGLRAGPRGPRAGVHLRSSPKSDNELSVDDGGTSGGVNEVKEALGLVMTSMSYARCANGANCARTS
jgi:hypothetical protein